MAGAVLARRLTGSRSSERTETSPRTRALWKADDLLRWCFMLAIGAVAIGVSWYVCAGDANFNQQIGPADAALGGLLVAGLGNATWLLRGRRALGERRRTLLGDGPAVAQPSVRRVEVARARSDDRPGETGELYVAGEGLERFHRSDCALAAGREGWQAMTRQGHETAGRRACDVCRP
ncbi:MAG TPA: hypothetical protein VGF87_10755 [Acidimicrobiales bacterium]|jgi:hypothetical protein